MTHIICIYIYLCVCVCVCVCAHVKFKINNNMLHSDSIKDFLNYIKNQQPPQFDLANGNSAVVCKGFYGLSVIKELRLRQNHTTTPCSTCTTCVDTTNDQLIDNTVNTILGELPLMLITNRSRQCIVYLNNIKTYKH